jgi:hypothetical protein
VITIPISTINTIESKNIHDFKINTTKEINSCFRIVNKENYSFDFIPTLIEKSQINNLIRILQKFCIITDISHVYAFKFFKYHSQKFSEEEMEFGWKLFNTKKEFKRQGLIFDKWRLSSINSKYELCETYPSKLIFPQNASDELLKLASNFRSKNRLPALTFYNQKNEATLSRCSQPLVLFSFKYI